MSINTWYLCIDPERLQRLIEETRRDPDAPAKYIHPPELPDDYEHPEPSLWTERNWLGLHSLLTFGDWANQPFLGAAIGGGTRFGRDYCYRDEPVRYLWRSEVVVIAEALAGVSEEALRRTCDADRLNEARVPPVGGWREGDYVHLWKTFTRIRDFYAQAAAGGYAVLIYLG
jgi:hypothetical protein